MSIQNLYLKQISCLQSPVNNDGWHEIGIHFPKVLECLAERAIVEKPGQTAFEVAPAPLAKSNEQGVEERTINEPISWRSVDAIQNGKHNEKPFQLKRFVYDCSYLSPFVRNVYMREESDKGCYRWVGPDPVLEVKLPLAPADSEHWLFTATFHAFRDKAHAKRIIFTVNEKSRQFEWVKGSTYQSIITTADLFGTAQPSEMATPSLKIAVPEAGMASEIDQRILAFAILRLSLTPS